MIRPVIISEFWKDVDELMDEYSPTGHKFNGAHMHVPKVTTGSVSAGAIVFDDESGTMKMFNGSTWVEAVKK
jgi:hypothetical protein